jgi:hypothetical protein
MVDLPYLAQRMMVLTVETRHVTAVQFCDTTDQETDQSLRRALARRNGAEAPDPSSPVTRAPATVFQHRVLEPIIRSSVQLIRKYPTFILPILSLGNNVQLVSSPTFNVSSVVYWHVGRYGG